MTSHHCNSFCVYHEAYPAKKVDALMKSPGNLASKQRDFGSYWMMFGCFYNKVEQACSFRRKHFIIYCLLLLLPLFLNLLFAAHGLPKLLFLLLLHPTLASTAMAVACCCFCWCCCCCCCCCGGGGLQGRKHFQGEGSDVIVKNRAKIDARLC